MSSGALGRGSYRSVVAGVNPRRIPTYYSSAYELIQLYRANRDVTRPRQGLRQQVSWLRFGQRSLQKGAEQA